MVGEKQQGTEWEGRRQGWWSRGMEAPEEARLVDSIVLLHHFAPVSLKLLDPSLLGLCRLCSLLQVSGQPVPSVEPPTLKGPPRSIQGFCPCPVLPSDRSHLPGGNTKRRIQSQVCAQTPMGGEAWRFPEWLPPGTGLWSGRRTRVRGRQGPFQLCRSAHSAPRQSWVKERSFAHSLGALRSRGRQGAGAGGLCAAALTSAQPARAPHLLGFQMLTTRLGSAVQPLMPLSEKSRWEDLTLRRTRPPCTSWTLELSTWPGVGCGRGA